MALQTLAPAKINLYLHVVGRRDDGYHLLDSLVVFADIGDRLTAQPADRLSLVVTGPEAGPLATIGDDNLVLRAARFLLPRAGAPGCPGAALLLDKRVPVASGIGGGSSDAAAVLRLLERIWRRSPASRDNVALAASLGADVPACAAGRPVWVGGVGERLEAANGLPAAGIVLVNPRCPLPTAAVFRARHGPFGTSGRFNPVPHDAAELAALLTERRNDLTESARALAPEIATVLQCLEGLPGVLLARMSGSGATCFALFADRAAAVAAGQILAEDWPEWWSAAGELLTEPPPIEEIDDRVPTCQPDGG